MKKKLFATIVGAIMALTLTACSRANYETTESKEAEYSVEPSSMFVCVEETPQWSVVYHKDTKVMYVATHDELLLSGAYRLKEFTAMLDCDGKPLLYSEQSFCSNCNASVEDADKFCSECGAIQG